VQTTSIQAPAFKLMLLNEINANGANFLLGIPTKSRERNVLSFPQNPQEQNGQ
jgi:hypothetical protein